MAYLALSGIDEALALWPEHWDEGYDLVRYQNGEQVAVEDVLDPVALAASFGVSILA